MSVITVPFDYNEITHPDVVPICIADSDDEGRPVHLGWVEHGVVPVTGSLIKTSERLLSDRFRASEIAEYAVHSLSRIYGANLGDHPTVRVLNSARLRAVDLRAGGRRLRRKLDVDLFAETLDALQDQYVFAAALEAKDTVDKIVAQLDILGLD